MKSRNWRSGFGHACAAISLFGCGLNAQNPPAKVPLLVVLDGAEAEQWRAWSAERGWRVLAASAVAEKSIDLRILALQGSVAATLRDSGIDPERVYLAGRGDFAAAAFYVAARVPDLWTAVAVIGGSPQPAIDSERFFAVNFTQLPLLWVGAPGDEKVAAKLKSAGVNLEYRAAGGTTPTNVLDWLAAHHRDRFPDEVDCETTSPQFSSCYWVQMTKFDAAARNDVLPTTRLQPGSRATLDLGGFSYAPEDKGPGVLVNGLAEKYNGPLRLNDRIVAMAGKPLQDAAELARILEAATEDKAVVVTVQRGKDRVRIETRILVPQRQEVISARVQAKYLPEEREIEVISRTASELRVMVPEAWVGATLNWNGTAVARVDSPGCWQLVLDKQLLQSATRCPQH